MKFHSAVLASTMLAATIAASSAYATPVLVSTIDGGYDIYTADSPSLTISNTTLYDFNNVQMTLTGYQGLNNGVTATFSLGTIAAGTTRILDWGVGPQPFAQGSLYTFDYDDTYGGTGYTNPGCTVGTFYCALVGNFETSITATWANPAYGMGSGTLISSVFTPAINASGTFVGWEGLDPSGLSETSYDAHSGTPHGVLANIYVGRVSLTPEPATWAMMLIGFAGIGYAARRRVRIALAPV